MIVIQIFRGQAIALVCAALLLVSARAGAEVELVLVAEVIGIDEGIIVRESGSAYRIFKDVGCLAFSLHEGRRVLINSPRGGFLGENAEVVLLEEGQRCKIVDHDPIGYWEGSNLEMSERLERLTRHEVRTLVQAALQVLDYFPFEIDGQLSAEMESALKEFQRVHRIQATGKIGPVTTLALAGDVEHRYDEDPGVQAIGMLLRRDAAAELDCNTGYRVGVVNDGGRRLVLKDRSQWRIAVADSAVLSEWSKNDEVMICGHVIMNMNTGTIVAIEREEE